MLSITLRLNFCYLEIVHILYPRYHPKIIGRILKKKQKNKCVCFHEHIRLIIMKMEMKMKNRSHRYDINRPRSKHGHWYSKWKKRHSKMMLICIRQHPNNIWSSIHEKLSKTEAELKKSVKRVFCINLAISFELLKWQEINHSYLKKTTWTITLVRHWSPHFFCFCFYPPVSWITYRLGYSCFVGIKLRTFSTTHG